MSLPPLGLNPNQLVPLGQRVQRSSLRSPLGWFAKPLGQAFPPLQPPPPLGSRVQTALRQDSFFDARELSWSSSAESTSTPQPASDQLAVEPTPSPDRSPPRVTVPTDSVQLKPSEPRPSSEAAFNRVQLKPLGHSEPIAQTADLLDSQPLLNLSALPMDKARSETIAADAGKVENAETLGREDAEISEVAAFSQDLATPPPVTAPTPEPELAAPIAPQPAAETQFAAPTQTASLAEDPVVQARLEPLSAETPAAEVLLARWSQTGLCPSTAETPATEISLSSPIPEITPSSSHQPRQTEALSEQDEVVSHPDSASLEAVSPSPENAVTSTATETAAESIAPTQSDARPDVIQPSLESVSQVPSQAPAIRLSDQVAENKAASTLQTISDVTEAIPPQTLAPPGLEPLPANTPVQEIQQSEAGSADDETVAISSPHLVAEASSEEVVQASAKIQLKAESPTEAFTTPPAAPMVSDRALPYAAQEDAPAGDRDISVPSDIASRIATPETNKPPDFTPSAPEPLTAPDRDLRLPSRKPDVEIQTLPTLPQSSITSPETAALQPQQIESLPLLKPLGASEPIAQTSLLVSLLPSESPNQPPTSIKPTAASLAESALSDALSNDTNLEHSTSDDAESSAVQPLSPPSVQLKSASIPQSGAKDASASWSNLAELLNIDADTPTAPLQPMVTDQALPYAPPPPLGVSRSLISANEPLSDLNSDSTAPIRRSVSAAPSETSNENKPTWLNLNELIGEFLPSTEQPSEEAASSDELTYSTPASSSEPAISASSSGSIQTLLQPVGQNSQNAVADQQLEVLAQKVYQSMRQYLDFNQERYSNRSIGYPIWSSPVISTDKIAKEKLNEPLSASSEDAAIDSKIQTLTREIYSQIQQRVAVDRERQGYSKLF